ncbi:MAG TPA: cysteine desulfurase family protein [Candidatus Saccharimonadales bacterium]|nr:cysteine desulfurase family protein [Candidatus Saccharimonadales bacterium]
MTNKTQVYLDYAAATPMDGRVLAAMQPYYTDNFYNPSATYLNAGNVAKDLQKARESTARWLGARPAEILFTAGGTEANNLAVQGIMRQYPDANIVVSAIEHESVLASAAIFDCRIAPVNEKGVVDVEKLADLIDDKTVLVSVMYANNEVGTIQPIKDIAQIIKQKQSARTQYLPLYFHTDAAQAANYLDLHVSRLGVDLMTLNGGKIYGPKQSGALFVGSQVELQPLIYGGGQERGLRSGTENVAAAIGFSTALEIAQTIRHEETARLQELQDYFIRQLQEKIPRIIFNGSTKKRLPNNVHITIPSADNERLIFQLDESGIMAAAGSACSASNDEPSHVLRAMGFSDDDARASLRFTMGRATTKRDIEHAVTALQTALT